MKMNWKYIVLIDVIFEIVIQRQVHADDAFGTRNFAGAFATGEFYI